MRDADRTTGQGPSGGRGGRWGGRQTALAFAGVLALVLIVLGVGSFLARRSGGTVDVRPIGADATATGTARASVQAGSALATGTATGAPTRAATPVTTVLTATAVSVVTPTANPTGVPAVTATATAVPSPSVSPTGARTVIYSTDFANWFKGEEGGQYPVRASIDPTTGEYRVALLGPQRGYDNYRLTPDGRQFDNFQLDIDARKIAGPINGGYGVVFRVQPTAPGAASNEFYNFVITADGRYTLNLVNSEGRGTPLTPRGSSSAAIARGDVANHLTVVCRGTEITLAVNGQTLGTFTGPLIAPGNVGVYVADLPSAGNAPPMEVAFSNFVISSVP